MRSLFIECSTGLSGDMLLGAFLDLKVPRELIEASLNSIGLENCYQIKVNDDKSYGLRGIKVDVIQTEKHPPLRKWKEIEKTLFESSLNARLKEKVIKVFKVLADSEAKVHGCLIDEVHFHEIGAIDSLVDIIGVCVCIDYLDVGEIICSYPPSGSGSVQTSHGKLPVPVPAVVEIAKENNIQLIWDQSHPKEELTTPTGIALMAVFATEFGQPNSLPISSIGVGLGHKTLDRPNLLRVFELNSGQISSEQLSKSINCQSLFIQEAWIDDSNPEDISNFCNELRSLGALEVVCQSVQMKKNRSGVLISSLTTSENLLALREKWFELSSTIGLRERVELRYSLQRRSGYCSTPIGRILVKQVLRPNGVLTIKPEHNDIIRISKETGKTIEEVRRFVYLSEDTFETDMDWNPI